MVSTAAGSRTCCPPTCARNSGNMGRVAADADIDAAVILIVGAIHGQVLPQLIFSLPGSTITVSPDVAGRLAATILAGIEPPPGAPAPAPAPAQ